jgi:hypothetical protein
VGPALTGPAEAAATSYLALADRVLSGRVSALYLVGSAALGAFRPGRSDVDLVVVLDAEIDARRLRALHLRSGVRTALRAVGTRHGPLTGTCNAVFVRAGDLRRPVTEIRPVGSHTGPTVSIGTAFDVNPVTWKVLHERGIPLRGPAPGELGLDPQPELLRSWNVENLRRYWRPWAERARRERRPRTRLRPRWGTAWGALGPPRLHHTVATGGVVAKEEAGAYALDTFDRRWHPVIREALAYRAGRPRDPSVEQRDAACFALAVVEDASRR